MYRNFKQIATIFLVGIIVITTNYAQTENSNQMIFLDIHDYYLQSEAISQLFLNVQQRLEADEIEIVDSQGDYPRLTIIEANIHTVPNTSITVASNYPKQIANSSYVITNFAYGFSIENIDTEDAEHFIVGFTHYSLGNYEQALEYLLLIEDKTTDVNFYIANNFLAIDEYEQAHTYFNTILDNSSEHPFSVINNLAWTLFKLGENENAIEIFDEALLNSSQPSYRISLLSRRAQLYALSLDYDSAIIDIDEAVNLAEENKLDNETLAELYTIRGEIIFLIYEWDRVEDNFNMAIELNSDYSRAYFQRGVLFYTMARRDDALADFQTYLDLDENGIYTEEAQSYIESIEIELEALGD